MDQVLICGDYNFKQINLEYHYVDGGIESEQSKLYDGSQDAFLHQHVREFTRARWSDTPSLLDLIFTKDEVDINNLHSPYWKQWS